MDESSQSSDASGDTAPNKAARRGEHTQVVVVDDDQIAAMHRMRSNHERAKRKRRRSAWMPEPACYERRGAVGPARLSDDNLVEIFKRLSLADLLRCRAVCRRWRRVANDPRLWRTLSFADCPRVDSAALVNICRVTPVLRCLRRLDLSCVHNVTEASVRAIPRAPCAATLTAVDLSRCSGSTDKSVVELSRCPSLRELRLAHCRSVTRKSVRILAARCPALQVLDLACISGVRDSLLVQVASNCRDLRELNLSNARAITDEGVTALSEHCTQMRILNLNWCAKLTDLSVNKCARSMTRLTDIALNETRIGDPGVVELATRCSALRALHVARCGDISDHSIRIVVAQLSATLEEINIASCHAVSDPCVLELLNVCRKLSIADLSKLPSRPIAPLLDELTARDVQVFF